MVPAATPIAASARRWSTEAVPPERRLDYWVGAICEAFLEMDCSSREARHFDPLAAVPRGFFRRRAELGLGHAEEIGQPPAVFLLQLSRAALADVLLEITAVPSKHVRQLGQAGGVLPGEPGKPFARIHDVLLRFLQNVVNERFFLDK